MTPEELKQQAHKEFDELSIKLECEEMPELASLLQKLSGTAFEKQKVQVYKMLDSLIDRTVQATNERVVEIVGDMHLRHYIPEHFNPKENKEHHGYRNAQRDIIKALITNKSNTNK